MVRRVATLLTVLALVACCTAKVYWFGSEGQTTVLADCNSNNRPASLLNYCSYSTIQTLPDEDNTIYFNDTLTSWPEINPYGTLGTSLTISSDFDDNGLFQPGNVLSVNSATTKLILNNLSLKGRQLQIHATVAALEVTNCNWEYAESIAFNSYDLSPQSYPISIKNVTASWYGSTIFLHFPNTPKNLTIADSTFKCVEDPTQPFFTCAALLRTSDTTASEFVLLKNVNMTGADNFTAYSYESPWIDINAQEVYLQNVRMEGMVLTPLSVRAERISIVGSTIERSTRATSYGCSTKCNEGYGGTHYDEDTGLYMTFHSSVLSTLRLIGNQFKSVSAFIDYETNNWIGTVKQDVIVRQNTFWNGAINVGPLNETIPAIIDDNTFNRYNVTFPSISVSGTVYINYTNYIYEQDNNFAVACNIFLNDGVEVYGGTSIDMLCLNGTINMRQFVSTVYKSVVGVQEQASLNLFDHSYFSLYGAALVYGVNITVQPTSTIQIQKGSLTDAIDVIPPSRVELLSGGNMYLYLPTSVPGVHVNMSIPLTTPTSYWEIEGDPSFDVTGTDRFGGYFTNTSGLAFWVDKTYCPCQNDGTCYERLTNCNCTGSFSGPFCGCSTAGIPSVASCDSSGGQRWIIPDNWDLIPGRSLQIPDGYEFIIAGNCTNNGTIFIGANTTMTTTGAFVNNGQLVLSSTLSKVDLGGGRCAITPNSGIEAGSFSIGSSSSVQINLDALGLPSDSNCDLELRDFFRRNSLAVDESSASITANGTSQLDGKWNVTVRSSPSTTATIPLTRSPPGSSTSSTLEVETHLSEGSCGEVSSGSGLLSLAISPCDGATPTPTSPTSSKRQVKWWWYGIPIIAVVTIVIIVLVVILTVPRFGKSVLPYRGTRM